jgi:hypothetical protein
MGTWWGGSFTEDPEVYIKEGSGDEHLSPLDSAGKPGGELIYRGL